MRRVAPMLLIATLAACAQTTPPAPKTVIFFPHASSALDPAAESSITLAASQANADPSALVTVAGYAAANGDLDADAQLAAARAQLVANLLQHDGVAASRIQVIPRQPSDEFSKSVGARRVEITIGAGS